MRSTGFCLIYDKFDLLKKYEPRHRKFAVIIQKIVCLFTRWDWNNMLNKVIKERLRRQIKLRN